MVKRKSKFVKLTPAVIRAAATDKGNRSMKRAGRTALNEDDWNVAAETFAKLLGEA